MYRPISDQKLNGSLVITKCITLYKFTFYAYIHTCTLRRVDVPMYLDFEYISKGMYYKLISICFFITS